MSVTADFGVVDGLAVVQDVALMQQGSSLSKLVKGRVTKFLTAVVASKSTTIELVTLLSVVSVVDVAAV